MNKCKNCGADYGLHHYETNQCPAGGVEAPVGRPQVWMSVTFEESANSQLEAELQEMKAERDALRAKVTQLADLIEGVADDDVDCPFCLVVGDRNHRPHCLVNVARAAAKEVQP